MPTLCHLTGSVPAKDPQWDGIDIWKLLEPDTDDLETAIPDRPLYWNLRGNQFAIRDGRWKLIIRENPGGIPTELFDLESDPGETTDRAETEPETVARLRTAIEEHRKLDGVSARPEVTGPDVEDPETEP